MTIFFPDVSQYTPVSLVGAPVVLARCSIGLVKDTQWDSFLADAATHHVPLAAYHFLNAGSLGASAEAQAEYAYSIVGSRPLMLDHEPNRGACASLDEGMRFIRRFRAVGGTVHLAYLPKWAWENNLGSASLIGLRDAGVGLVSSNYTTYSDTGPGWASYGGMWPVQWQFTDRYVFNGVGVDWNAYQGDISAYLALITGDPTVTDVNDFTKACTGAANRGNSRDDLLADDGNLRDEWYLLPDAHSKNPPPVGSRFDLLLQAVNKINTTNFGALGVLTEAQLQEQADRIAAALVASGTNTLTAADHEALKADIATVLSNSRISTTTG